MIDVQPPRGDVQPPRGDAPPPRGDAPPPRGGSKRALRVLLAATGALCAIATALATHDPPPARQVEFLATDATLAWRLFPGVDAAWVGARLAMLAAGGALLGWLASIGWRIDDDARIPSRPSHVDPYPGAASRWLPLAALLAAASGPVAAALPRAAQFAWLALLLAVPLLAARAETRAEFAGRASAPRRWLGEVPPAALVAAFAWIVHRAAVSIGSPRTADGLDYLDGYLCYEKAAASDFHVLSGACWDGYTTFAGILHGQGVLGWAGIPLSLPLVQWISTAWTALAALLVARVVARHLGEGAAVVGTAVFLWSPIVLLRPLVPPPFTYTTIAALLLALGDSIVRDARPSRAAAFGAVAGIGSHVPNLVLLGPLLVLGALPSLLRAPRAAFVAAGFFLATALPGAGEHLAMLERAGSLSSASASWSAMEAVYSGRVAPSLAEGTKGIGSGKATDVAIGLALSPFAIARASLRLWGDSLLEPFGAVLVAAGLVAAAASMASSAPARGVLAFALAAMLPGLLSSYDRLHPTRIEIALAAMLLVSFAWSGLARSLPSRAASRVAALVALVVAVSGTRLFDVVTPPLLSPSAAGLALRAGAALPHEVGWSPGVSGLSLPYMRVLSFQLTGGRLFGWNPAAVHRRLPEPHSPVVLWTPGEQMDSRVSHVLCEQGSGRRLYEIADRHGATRLFAAMRGDLPEPASTAEARWTPIACGETLVTDAVVASAALEEAARLAGEDRAGEAERVLRRAASRTIAQPRLYVPLASLLAARGERGEALEWATLACRITQGSWYEACALARTLAAPQSGATPG